MYVCECLCVCVGCVRVRDGACASVRVFKVAIKKDYPLRYKIICDKIS